MLKTIKHTTTLFAALFFGAALFISCDTTSTDDHDEHLDATGFVIVQNNAEIVRYQNNEYIWNPSGTWDSYFREGSDGIVISPDVIELSEDNPRGMTPSVTIRWIDADGDVFDLDDLSEEEGGEYWLDWSWDAPNTLTEECSDEAREDLEALDQIRPANLEQHGSDGEWGFHFRADHAGQGQLTFRLMHGHGTEAHSDFTSQPMTVIVPHDEHSLIDENGIYMHTRSKCRTDRPR
ncbi:hypothetical protein DYD21_19230 [Rhodohalobacter sp. SW132]|uniref:hypothetical protein n=1 Tax=Rhodohalobacter sp. SW132 TaxID=2293433 RepID=UPI000E221E07|nr:hypothetical protein [Rhodohalobacter sp. SW132]REL24341.1 hypothetical protein DYD21_19230 [Rhodohalobacter sp. SW132]